MKSLKKKLYIGIYITSLAFNIYFKYTLKAQKIKEFSLKI